jgi:hypothetical protein
VDLGARNKILMDLEDLMESNKILLIDHLEDLMESKKILLQKSNVHIAV